MDDTLSRSRNDTVQQNTEKEIFIRAWVEMLRLYLDDNDKINEQEYEKLFRWIVNLFFLYEMKARRRGSELQLVVITRRCAVLVEICMRLAAFYQDKPDDRRPAFFRNVDLAQLLRLDRECCITDAAAIARIPKWLDSYDTNGSFPLLVVFDDIMLHGRACNVLLAQMEHDLKTYCKKNYSAAESSTLLDDFIESVYTEVYTRCERGLLLLPRYYYRYRAQQSYTLAQCRKLSYKIALAIASSTVCNVGPAWGLIGREALDPKYPQHRLENFIQVKTECGEGEDGTVTIDHFLWFYPNIQCPTVIGSISVKPSAATNQLMLMPSVMISKASCSGFFRVAHALAHASAACDAFFHACGLDLSMQINEASDMRRLVNTVELVLSKLLCERFLKLWGRDKTEFIPNSRHLARCFGVEQQKIETLYEEVWESSAQIQLEEFLSMLSNGAEPFWYDESCADFERWQEIRDSEKIRDLLRTTVAEVGLESEKHAFRLSLQKTPFTDEALSSRGKRFSLREIFDEVEVLYQKNHPGEGIDRAHMVGWLLQLTDHGMAGLKRWCMPDTGRICTEVTAGEPSLFLKPLQFAKYLIALEDIQETCRLDEIPIKKEINKFIEIIDKTSSKKDKELLAEELACFVEGLNDSGQEVSDWMFPVQFSVYSLGFVRDEASLKRSVENILHKRNEYYKKQVKEQLDNMLAYHLA